MGQTNTKIKANNKSIVKGGISIQIPKIQFSNEIIQGVLHINLEESFQGHILMLTLEGLEEFYYIVPSGKTYLHYDEENKFLNLSIPIYDFAQAQNNKLNSEQFNMNPGQWSIPFEMKIAQILPSSMQYYQTGCNNCRITYTLVAEIIPNDSNCRPIVGRQEIFIGQQLSMENQQEVKSESIVQPKCCDCCCCCCCCCFSQIQLRGKINKSSFAPKEKIKISLDCDFSRSSFSVRSVNVELKGQLIRSRKNGRQRTEYIKFSKQNVRVDSQNSFSTSIEIEVPESILLSTHSSLIELKHFVQVTPVLNESCGCIEVDKCLWLDVKIYSNPAPSSLQFLEIPNNVQLQSPPSNWNPMILQSQQYNEEEALKIQQLYLTHQQEKNKPQQNQNQNEQPQMVYPL